MPREGMVDALKEAHRVLTKGGVALDLRPDRQDDDSPSPGHFSFVEDDVHEVGRYVEQPGFIDDYRSSVRAVPEVVSHGVFDLEATEKFVMCIYFRSAEAIYAFHERGRDVLEPSARRRIASLFARYPDGRVVREEKALVNVLRKR